MFTWFWLKFSLGQCFLVDQDSAFLKFIKRFYAEEIQIYDDENGVDNKLEIELHCLSFCELLRESILMLDCLI